MQTVLTQSSIQSFKDQIQRLTQVKELVNTDMPCLNTLRSFLNLLYDLDKAEDVAPMSQLRKIESISEGSEDLVSSPAGGVGEATRVKGKPMIRKKAIVPADK